MDWKEEFEKEFNFMSIDGNPLETEAFKQDLFIAIEKVVIEKLIEEIPATAVTDEKWEGGKWVQYRSYHSVQEQLRAKWLKEQP